MGYNVSENFEYVRNKAQFNSSNLVDLDFIYSEKKWSNHLVDLLFVEIRNDSEELKDFAPIKIGIKGN